jgi:hypothetical protein
MEQENTSASATAINLKMRIVRVLPAPTGTHEVAMDDEETQHLAEGDENWRELLKHEVLRHSFALLSFSPQGNGHKKTQSKQQTKGDHSSEATLAGLLEDHRQGVRPQFFAQSLEFKRRLDGERTTAKLGDTGYCLRESIKEQLQVRLGPHMPWPSSPTTAAPKAQVDKDKGKDGRGGCDGEDDDDVAKYRLMQGELEALFAVLDGVARKCASALVGDGARTRLHGALDPSSADLLGEGINQEGEYTSSSVMTLTHYFNTEQVTYDLVFFLFFFFFFLR